MRKLILFALLVLSFASVASGADITVCASGCDGTIATMAARTAPFDDLRGDTIYFTGLISSLIELKPASYGTAENERATLDFSGTTFSRAGYAILETDGADYVAITGITATAGGSENYGAINIQGGSTNVTIENCNLILSSGSSGIFTGSGVSNCKIVGNTIDGNGYSSDLIRIANSTANSHHFIVGEEGNGNILINSGDCAITMESVSGTPIFYNIDIGYNTILDSKHQGIRLLPQWDAGANSCYSIDIHNNNIYRSGRDAIEVVSIDASNYPSYIRHNYCENIGLNTTSTLVNGIRCGSALGLEIYGNVINGVYTDTPSYDGNGIICDRWLYGELSRPSENCLIYGNVVHGCALATGAGFIDYMSQGTIFFSNISYDNIIGVALGSGSTGSIYNCTAINNTNYGISVGALATSGVVTGNISYGNGFDIARIAGGPNPTAEVNCYGSIAPDNDDFDAIVCTDCITDDPQLDSEYYPQNSALKSSGTKITGVDNYYDGTAILNGNVTIGALPYRPNRTAGLLLSNMIIGAKPETEVTTWQGESITWQGETATW